MVRMLFIALALLLVQPAFLTRPALAADPYSIDVLLPVTGGGAFFGKAEADALRVYEGVVNKSGGIHGQPVHFDVHDDQSNPIIDLQLVRQIMQRHPAVILGPSVSATSEAIVPLFNDGPVLFVFSPGVVPPTGSYVFAASATLEANVLSAYAALKGLGCDGTEKFRIYERILFIERQPWSGTRGQ
jgi:branched-chain amino acid transport system substrate-binding protein